jgi:hypothetical protein
MDPITLGAIISGVGSLAGGLMGGSSAGSQAKADREWQTMMSNTQYQRASEDMRKAGLNPMMVYSHGGGQAAVPSVPVRTSPGEAAGAGVANAARELAKLPQAKADLAATNQNAATSAANAKAAAASEALSREQAATQESVRMANLAQATATTLQGERTKAETAYTLGSMDKLRAEVAEIASRIKLNSSSASKNAADTRSTLTGLPIKETEAELAKKTGQAAKNASALVPALWSGAKAWWQTPAIGDRLQGSATDAYNRFIFNLHQSQARKPSSAAAVANSFSNK